MKYFDIAEYFPTSQLDLWSKDGVSTDIVDERQINNSNVCCDYCKEHQGRLTDDSEKSL